MIVFAVAPPALTARPRSTRRTSPPEVEARDPPGDKPPTRVIVLAGMEADLRRAMHEPVIEAVELVDADDTPALPPGDQPANP